MACGRRRRSAADGSGAGAGVPLRRDRLRRQAFRRQARFARAVPRSIRGRLLPRGGGRDRARSSADCRALVIDRNVSRSASRHCAYAPRRCLRTDAARPPGQDRPWARAQAAPADAPSSVRPAAATRCHAACRRTSRRETEALNTFGTARSSCPGCARGSAAGYAPHRRCWPARARSRRRGDGSA